MELQLILNSLDLVTVLQHNLFEFVSCCYSAAAAAAAAAAVSRRLLHCGYFLSAFGRCCGAGAV